MKITKIQIIYLLAKKITYDPNKKSNLTKITYVTFHLRVGEPTQLITSSIWVNRVKNQPVLKFIKKFNPTHLEPVINWIGSLIPITYFDSSTINRRSSYFINRN